MKFVVALLLPVMLYGEAGVLIPSGAQQPDPAALSLDEMNIRVRIDNQHVTVETRQIFASHTAKVLEGTYTFTLPGTALVSDFAVWDGVTRIPGVILERRRAEEIYEAARMQAIDPGLLQQGERDADEARRTAVFTARIVPIPAYGTKRLEMEYQERLPVEQFKTAFTIPLRPDAYHAQTVGRLTVSFELTSTLALKDFEVLSKTYPLIVKEKSARRVVAEMDARNVALTEDLALQYTLDPVKADNLDVIAHTGFFEATALFGMPKKSVETARRNVVVLFDNSLSMQWEKLERSYLALERTLRSLQPSDTFNLVLFNSEIAQLAPKSTPAAPEAIEKALAFVKASRLRGGTDLQSALKMGLSAVEGPASYLVLLSDGDVTRGPEIRNVKIADWYRAQPKRPRLMIFAVGDDANLPLLTLLARDNGVLEWVRSTEPPDFKLNAFITKIGRRPLEEPSLTAEPSSNFDLVYPLEETVFPGSTASWVGQYKQAMRANFTVKASREGAPVTLRRTENLPAENAEHPQLPREWAKARVDALLEKIDRDGEDRASIDEIIRLARKYKFVTPYTSFLAAPRALLRPRLIRPGDPVLRVHTDESIVSVVAMFPFGTVKPLRHLGDEDVWQTRFLAPPDLADGTHTVRLILRDREGRVFRESKTFVIVSKPPMVRVKLEKASFRRGEMVHVRASASDTSRTVMARMYGVTPVSLRWSDRDKSNAGAFVIPAQLAAGRYTLTVTAEDFAHNIGSQEVSIEVLP
jgi:Ca-activated chloride channel homolog